MNKKAITFGITFVIAVLVIIGVAIYFFAVTQKKTLQNTLTAKEILDFEQEKTRIEVYTKKAFELAMGEALHAMAERSLIEDFSECLFYESKPIWQENCKPENLKAWFFKIFSEKFSELIKRYPQEINFSYELFNNAIKVKIEFERKKNNSFNSFHGKGQANFAVETNFTELENLYQKLMYCKNKDENCFEKISLNECYIEAEKKGEYFSITIRSKKRYFFRKADSLVFEKIETEFLV
ncbi:MAG: hypothetical protein QXL88_00460 [Candidatus Pacearchaeota archaeon]